MFARSLCVVAACAAVCSARAYTNVEYARAAGESLRFDAVVPETEGPHPAVIIVHGGAWVTGDKSGSVRPLFQPLSNAGYAWFSINYRLARATDLAALVSPTAIAALQGAIDDVRNAVIYIRQHAAEYDIDPDRIALIGESAGAQLALMAAFSPIENSDVKAVAAFYAPSDLVDLVQNSDRIPDGIRKAVKGTPLEALFLAGLRQISPRFFLKPDSPPMLLLHGTRDGLVPYQQSEVLCEDAQALGASCQLYKVEGGGHGVRYWESMSAYKSELTGWLDKNLP